MYRKERLGGFDNEALNYSSSLKDDQWIFEADIWVDKAHLLMLYEEGYLTRKTSKKILKALKEIEEKGTDFLSEKEDIHEAIESKVIDLVGEEGGRLHTGRSRNDEVATCIRIASRKETINLIDQVIKTRKSLLKVGKENFDTLIPVYTHLQQAQPTTLAHHFSSHERRLSRDTGRLIDSLKRLNMSPLGSGAAASTTLSIDRERTAELLGFDSVVENSMDSVSSRDFVLELISICTSIMSAVSRISEEMVLWSSKEFGLIELSDAFSSTSSIMPQKKNPDVAELVRARASTVQGHQAAAFSLVKRLPLSYNRDLQELTPHLRNSLRITFRSLNILSKVVSTASFNSPDLDKSIAATDIAELLVEKDVPFREAHKMVSKVCKEGLNIGSAYNAFKKYLNREELEEAFNFEKSIEKRMQGGPGSSAKLLEKGKKEAVEHKNVLENFSSKIDRRHKILKKVLSSL